MKKLIVFLFLILSFAAGLILWPHQNKTEADISYQWTVGRELLYYLHYHSKGEGAFSVELAKQNQPVKNQKRLDIDIEGELSLALMEKRGEEYYLNAEFTANQFQTQLGFQKSIIPPPKAALSFQIIMTNRGSIEKIKMDKDDYAIYGDLFRDILALVELPLPVSGQSKWLSSEKHIGISHPVTFTLTGKKWFSSAWNIEKRYEKLKQASISGPLYYEFDDKHGLVAKVMGERRRRFLLGKSEVSQDTTNIEFSFKGFTESASDTVPEWAQSQDIIEDSLKGEQKRLEMRKRSKRTVLSGRDMEGVRAELSALNPEDTQEITKLSRQVVALLELYPENAQAISEWLFEYYINDDRFGAVASALTYVGSDEAQQALINVLNQLPVGEDKQVALMGNLAFVKTPNKAAEEYFRGMLSHRDNNAVFTKANLALGIIASHLTEADKPRQLEIFSDLQQQLEYSASARETRIYINAIGNIGIPEQVPVIQAYVENKNLDIGIRQEAVGALRFVKNAQSERLLVGYLNDNNDSIRVAAAEALAYSEGSQQALSAYKSRLFEERNISVLKHMLKHLADMSSTYPSSVALVDSFIAQCGHPELCDYVNQLRLTM